VYGLLKIIPPLSHTFSVRIFKNAWFDKFAEKDGITDAVLKEAVKEIEAGLVEANLGGGVYKKRIARGGGGKRGGYRTIVFFKSGDRTFFQYGFAKSDMENISPKALRAYRETSKNLLVLDDKQLDELAKDGEYSEIGV
jgi:hypothetical protein